mgnify:CR=1 FL=1
MIVPMSFEKQHISKTTTNENAQEDYLICFDALFDVVDYFVVNVMLRFANEMNLPQIGAQVKDFAARARSKKLTPQEMDDSTFTVSNLGMFGISEFTSIINQPNSAILSVGAIVQKPLVKEGEIVVGNTMKLTLACDHRTVDGATGAQFLQTLKEYIENPIRLVV